MKCPNTHNTYKLEVRGACFLESKRVLWFNPPEYSPGIIPRGANWAGVTSAPSCFEYSVKMIHERRAIVLFGIAIQSCWMEEHSYVEDCMK